MRCGLLSKISEATRLFFDLVCRLDNALSPLEHASTRHKLDSLNVSNDFQNK